MRSMEAPAPSTYTPETHEAPSPETEMNTPENPQTGQEYVQMQLERIKEAIRIIDGMRGHEQSEESLEETAKTILIKAAVAALIENSRTSPETAQPAATQEAPVAPPLSLEQIAADRAAAEQREHNRRMFAEYQRHNQQVEATIAAQHNTPATETAPAPASEYDPEDEDDEYDEEQEPYGEETAYYKEREEAARARIAARKAERREKRGEVRAELYDKAKGHAKRIGKAALRGFSRFAKRAKNAVVAGAGTIRSR